MGQQLPKTNNPVVPLGKKDIFESKYVQRVKDSPFIDAQLYTSKPPLFIDPTGPNLFQLVNPRLGTKQLFPEQQIVKLIVGFVNGLADLMQVGFGGHGDICLESMFYSSRDKCFKMTHPMFNEESGYLLAKHGKRFTTLSPEQLSALSEESQNEEVSFQSDIFAFGIMLCEVCTLTPSSDIYCPDTYSIFHLEIQKRVKIVEEYYSPQIAEFISMCLEYDPEVRPRVPDLLEVSRQLQGSQEMGMSRRQSGQ